MEYGSKEYNQIFQAFKKGRGILNDISVDIEDGGNVIPPLVLVRASDEEPTIDNTLALASQMVLNKHVKFLHKGNVVHEFTYNGGDLSEKFTDAPWLLDLLLKTCYGLMIKKLTPPSEDSEKEDKR